MNLKTTPATDEELAEAARANGVENLDQEPKGIKKRRFDGPGALLAHLERSTRRKAGAKR